MKKIIFIFVSIMILGSNLTTKAQKMSAIDQTTIQKTIKSLTTKYGEKNNFRINKGVTQAASYWTVKDGNSHEFETFCEENFINDIIKLDMVFQKISTNLEILNGNYNKMHLDLKMPLDLNVGDVLPIDEIFGAYDVTAHFTDDMFNNKFAFITLLNFPFYSLKEKIDQGMTWNRQQWAYARVGDLFTSRVPSDLLLKVSEATTNSESYISDYNIYMGNLVDNKGKTLFPKDMKLITHWGLRDELKSNYNKTGLEKQKMIYEVMKHIIKQDIPQQVINSDKQTWNPFTNKVFVDNKEVTFKPEPDIRYFHLLNNFKAQKLLDPYNPQYPNFISRTFEQSMEMPQEELENLFIKFITSPQVKEVAKLISKRLDRKLEPFDIWYDGFKPRSTMSESDLDAQLKAKYPNKDAFEKELPEILKKLGFTPDKAAYITSKVAVDASRGAGHAWGAQMKSDKAHLRTRINADGMNYKGYNIAVHEFGHNVEQTISLNEVDYYVLNGVPNNAFTEALAFIFQKRDLDLLGIKNSDPNKDHFITLDNFWSCFECMGVSLVDMDVWKWMYQHPDATPNQLKEQVIIISKDIWNKYYSPIFGSKDETILAIYSHMIEDPLYLSAYPIGYLIDFQIEKQIAGKSFATEVERIYKYGKIIPTVWMQNAVGGNVSIDPMMEATTEALKAIKK